MTNSCYLLKSWYTKALSSQVPFGTLVTLASDGRHPVKLMTSFVKRIKHLITDDGYPITQLNRFFTIVAHLSKKEWESAKDNPKQKQEYIEKLQEAEKELEESGDLRKQEVEEE